MHVIVVAGLCCLLLACTNADKSIGFKILNRRSILPMQSDYGHSRAGPEHSAEVALPQKSVVYCVRGGESKTGFNLNDMFRKATKLGSNAGNAEIVVATTIGSAFLDKKKKLTMRKDETVADLKLQLSKRFPGSPPVSLQHLYFASRILNDTEIIGNISAVSPIPIVLDMISGTSVYNKNVSVSQALEGYVATVVQQSYLGAQLQQLYKAESNGTELMATPGLRELFKSINTSVYEQYKDQIAAAKLLESEPDTASADTAAWRTQSTVSPLAAAIAKEFDLNGRSVRQYAFYSLVLVVFSLFGTATREGAAQLLYLIPVLWISKLRQLRLLFKIALNLALPVIYNSEFLLPVLPAPLQVIAQHSAEAVATSLQEEQEPAAPNSNAMNGDTIVGVISKLYCQARSALGFSAVSAEADDMDDPPSGEDDEYREGRESEEEEGDESGDGDEGDTDDAERSDDDTAG